MLAWVLLRFGPVGWAEEILDAATAASVCLFVGRAEAGEGYAQTAVTLEADPRYDGFETGWNSFWEAIAYLYAGRMDRTVEIGAVLAAQPGLARIAGLCLLTVGLPAIGGPRRPRP